MSWSTVTSSLKFATFEPEPVSPAMVASGLTKRSGALASVACTCWLAPLSFNQFGAADCAFSCSCIKQIQSAVFLVHCGIAQFANGLVNRTKTRRTERKHASFVFHFRAENFYGFGCLPTPPVARERHSRNKDAFGTVLTSAVEDV